MQSIPSDKFEIVLTLGCVYLALIVTFVLHLPTENPGSVFEGMVHVSSICELNECTEGFFRRGPCLRIPLGFPTFRKNLLPLWQDVLSSPFVAMISEKK